MAVYTDIKSNELEAFLTHYNLAPLFLYEGITEGVENSNFLLQTQAGPYILTLYEKRVRKDDLPFFLGLMQFLANKGISCPQPVQRRDGTLIGSLANRPAALFSFLNGIWTRKPSIPHCQAVGRALAKLHLVGRDFSMKRKNPLSVLGWRPLWEACRIKAKRFPSHVLVEIDAELDFLEKKWPDHLPTGVIHADLFPDNVFFLKTQLSGLIDFYFACNDAFAYDLAICLNAWCFEKDGSYNMTKSCALLSAYYKERSLEKDELAMLPLLARGAAMRFFLTRLYDLFYIPDSGLVIKKSPQDFLNRIRFFRKVSALGH
ncbi:MAG: homoserine kinase type II [Candidatus Tokpelaia sp. JSC161]|jgi:homoserine kinase type II|nr:MAG: homoserine kinase type II [Candidatus Tokpelaia sp. JSC161]